MTVNITVKLPGIRNMPKRLENGVNAAANQVMSEMEVYVPLRENHLRDGQKLAPDGHTITNNTPYARAQFYGFSRGGQRMRHYTTPGTGRRWDLRLKGNNAKMNHVRHALVKGAGF